MDAKLSRGSIVEAAIKVLDSGGLEGLTLRAVAAALGVQAPALYWHVRNKQELLDEMGTEIWRRVRTRAMDLAGGGAWDVQLRTFAEVARGELLAHRDGAKVFSGTYVTDAAILAGQEAQLAAMVAQGFSLADIVRAYSLLNSFVTGFCIEEQAVSQAGDDRYSLERRDERVGAGEHPLVAASGRAIFADPGERFADLVNVIIDAAGRMRAPRD